MRVETAAEAANSFQTFSTKFSKTLKWKEFNERRIAPNRLFEKTQQTKAVDPKKKTTQELCYLNIDHTLTDCLRCTSYNLGTMNQSEIKVSMCIQLQTWENMVKNEEKN